MSSGDTLALVLKAKYLFIVTALIEVGAGLTLAIVPSVAAALLFGARINAMIEMTLARLVGGALFALGTACWLARDDEHSHAARGVIVAMLIYNLAAVAVLTYAGFGSGLVSPALWPAVALHAALAVWCVACLWV